MFRYIFSTLLLGLFLFYGIITLIFITPDNYININLIKYNKNFNSFFYQRWGFFAPPPQSDDRLYYVFKNKKKKSEILIFEVIEPLLKQKHANAPFNSKEDLKDYLISNSIYLITDAIQSIQESIKHDAKINKKINEAETNKKVNKIIKKTKSYLTLLNYSKIIALNNKINYNEYQIDLKITHKIIPKFINRNNINNKTEEQLIFDSTN